MKRSAIIESCQNEDCGYTPFRLQGTGEPARCRRCGTPYKTIEDKINETEELSPGGGNGR